MVNVECHREWLECPVNKSFGWLVRWTDIIDLFGSLALLRHRINQDLVYGVHVYLHGCHATHGVAVVVA